MNRHVSSLMAAAQSPVAWQSQVARNVAWLHDVPRCSDWLLDDMTWPKLCDDSLLGATLTSVVNRKSKVEPETVGRARKSKDSSSPEPQHWTGMRATVSSSDLNAHASMTRRQGESQAAPLGAESRAHPSAAKAMALPQRASSALMSRWSREAVAASAKAAQRQSVAIRRPDLSRVVSQMDGSSSRNNLPSPRFTSKPVNRADAPVAQRDWLAKAGRRAYHVLQHHQEGTVQSSGQGGEALSSQWSASIAGPMAPLELLSRLAGMTRQADTARRNASRNPAADAPSTSYGIESHSLESKLEDQAGPNRPAQAQEQTNSISPPVLRQALPPLTPPQVVGAPVQPIASARAREGALAEAMSGGEDMDVLAAKIKHILDEQARRHGIDV
jgi:hypothetical protein